MANYSENGVIHAPRPWHEAVRAMPGFSAEGGVYITTEATLPEVGTVAMLSAPLEQGFRGLEKGIYFLSEQKLETLPEAPKDQVLLYVQEAILPPDVRPFITAPVPSHIPGSRELPKGTIVDLGNVYAIAPTGHSLSKFQVYEVLPVLPSVATEMFQDDTQMHIVLK